MEYYPATNRNEVLTPAATWMNSEDNMPSEVSQIPKDFMHEEARAVRSTDRRQGVAGRHWGGEWAVRI